MHPLFPPFFRNERKDCVKNEDRTRKKRGIGGGKKKERGQIPLPERLKKGGKRGCLLSRSFLDRNNKKEKKEERSRKEGGKKEDRKIKEKGKEEEGKIRERRQKEKRKKRNKKEWKRNERKDGVKSSFFTELSSLKGDKRKRGQKEDRKMKKGGKRGCKE